MTNIPAAKKFFSLAALLIFALFGSVCCAWAQGAPTAGDAFIFLPHRTLLLVFQLAAVIFAARLGAFACERIKVPPLLGEIAAGMVIGPYFLGKIPLPGFAAGLFPFYEGVPVSPELYSLGALASIILLFYVGLSSDLPRLVKYSLAGALVGAGGVMVSFICGDLAVVLFSQQFLGVSYKFTDTVPMFLGVVSGATSVGVAARVLLDKRKIDSPEGVTILSGAVIDDVVAIILLAVVTGIAKSGNANIGHVAALISLKSLLLIVGVTVLGLYFARRLGQLLKRTCRSTITMMIVALGMAILLAGIFEKANLFLIIGAYIAGLIFSKTDIVYAIKENLAVVYRFLVPVFFCMMGMMVDPNYFLTESVLKMGLIFTGFAIVGKFAGCALPLAFMNFSFNGIMRVGIGMIPRGEFAFIIAGIGLANGMLSEKHFSIAIIMTFLTTLLGPFMFARVLSIKRPVLKKDDESNPAEKEVVFNMPNPQTMELVCNKIIAALEADGFFVHCPDVYDKYYSIRRDKTVIMMDVKDGDKLAFRCHEKDEPFVHILFYEIIGELEDTLRSLKSLSSREEMGVKQLGKTKPHADEKNLLPGLLRPDAIECFLKSRTKPEILDELMDVMIRSGQMLECDRDEVLGLLLEREAKISTGFQDGVAMPHAKTDFVKDLVCAIGIKKDGMDFSALDMKPSKIFFMTLAPRKASESQLQLMAQISRLLMRPDVREKMLSCDNSSDVYRVLTEQVK